MASPTEVPTFEFLDLSGIDAPGRSDDPSPPSRLVGVVAMAGVLVALILIGVAASGTADDPDSDAAAPPSTRDSLSRSTASPTRATSPPQASARVSSGLATDPLVPWPNPPQDRNPTIIRVPGPDSPLTGNVSEMAVVYVNTGGRPTVIDLDSGTVEQVDIAASRAYDFFGVEFGRVVAFEGQNRNLDKATDRALLFHIHRAGSSASIDEYRPSANPSPHLCLTEEPCLNDMWTFEHITNDIDTIRRANEFDDPAVMEMLYGDSWIVDGGQRSAPVVLGFDLRIPAPMNQEAWIVHQPGSPK